jgi:hypothetical protein
MVMVGIGHMDVRVPLWLVPVNVAVRPDWHGIVCMVMVPVVVAMGMLVF